MEHRKFTFCRKAHALSASVFFFMALSWGLGLRPAAAQKPVLTTLHHFDDRHGFRPLAGMTMGADGDLYGTTYWGGLGYGTIFKMTPQGRFTTLWAFNKTNGSYPLAPPVQGADGSLYGTTGGGGVNDTGTIYRITPQGRLTTLYAFPTVQNYVNQDGRGPTGALSVGADGAWYGVTGSGGTHALGTLFRWSQTDGLRVLCEFADGSYRVGPLAQDASGTWYGVAYQGGNDYVGNVYSVTPDGTYHLLHTFDYVSGAHPQAGLTAGPDGAIYGVATDSVAPVTDMGEGGTAFRITPDGKFTILHRFHYDDYGVHPTGPLALGADGLFYGTTAGYPFMGPYYGEIFSMTPAGQVTILYKFHPAPDGSFPHGRRATYGVVFGPDGALYGVADTSYLGNDDVGTIFRLTLP